MCQCGTISLLKLLQAITTGIVHPSMPNCLFWEELCWEELKKVLFSTCAMDGKVFVPSAFLNLFKYTLFQIDRFAFSNLMHNFSNILPVCLCCKTEGYDKEC